MKKIFLILGILSFCLIVHAQKNKRFIFSTAIGSGIDMTMPIHTPFTWQLTGHYKLNEQVLVGAGTGFSFYEKMLIPVYADIKFLITQPRKITPFIEGSGGYSFVPYKNTNGGLYLYPSLGVQYSISKEHQLYMTLGYEIQKFERLKTFTNPLYTAEFVEKLNHNLVSLRIGYTF